ncbi:MAG: MBOAT family protein [Clostridiales bacterium]|nr:MBOAT family protein [Clostridiales bacterium]
MVFSSLFFVFFFLPLNLFFYHLAKTTNAKNTVLLIFSLIFYAWGGPKYVILLLAMVFIAWMGAIIVYHSAYRRIVLAVTIALMLALLGYFKYWGFFLSGVQMITGFPETIPDIVLPIGISFYTFQLISYVVDVYRCEVRPQKRYRLLLLYGSLFHQCIAGPIVRYRDVCREILHRKASHPEIGKGIRRFSIGLAKKAILANGCAAIADSFLLTDDMSALAQVPAAGLWLGVLCFTLEIYLDFSAYSDMAIGMGLMIGFHYRENFNYPYMADSITDFWRRWHISLSSFFRDYVYIPLGGNRRGMTRMFLNLFIVWFLTGMWHGASWNYILWGLYFFVFLVIEKKVLLNKLRFSPVFVPHLYALVVIFFGWILFKFENLAGVGITLKGMFGLNANGFMNMTVGLSFKNHIFFLIFAIIASTPLIKIIRSKILSAHYVRGRLPVLVYAYDIVAPVVLLVLSALALVGNSYNPFLYFQF